MTTPSGPTSLAHILGFCEHRGAILSKNAANNAIGMYCDECRSWVTKAKGFDRVWLSKEHPALTGVDVASIPVVGLKHYRKCEGPCKQLAFCQLHHTAPRKFFGDACDDWPMVYLCTRCHARWHDIVTPGLSGSHDAHVHAEQLIEYLGLDRAAALTRALMDIGRAKRAGAA